MDKKCIELLRNASCDEEMFAGLLMIPKFLSNSNGSLDDKSKDALLDQTYEIVCPGFLLRLARSGEKDYVSLYCTLLASFCTLEKISKSETILVLVQELCVILKNHTIAKEEEVVAEIVFSFLTIGNHNEKAKELILRHSNIIDLLLEKKKNDSDDTNLFDLCLLLFSCQTKLDSKDIIEQILVPFGSTLLLSPPIPNYFEVLTLLDNFLSLYSSHSFFLPNSNSKNNSDSNSSFLFPFRNVFENLLKSKITPEKRYLVFDIIWRFLFSFGFSWLVGSDLFSLVIGLCSMEIKLLFNNEISDDNKNEVDAYMKEGVQAIVNIFLLTIKFLVALNDDDSADDMIDANVVCYILEALHSAAESILLFCRVFHENNDQSSSFMEFIVMSLPFLGSWLAEETEKLSFLFLENLSFFLGILENNSECLEMFFSLFSAMTKDSMERKVFFLKNGHLLIMKYMDNYLPTFLKNENDEKKCIFECILICLNLLISEEINDSDNDNDRDELVSSAKDFSHHFLINISPLLWDFLVEKSLSENLRFSSENMSSSIIYTMILTLYRRIIFENEKNHNRSGLDDGYELVYELLLNVCENLSCQNRLPDIIIELAISICNSIDSQNRIFKKKELTNLINQLNLFDFDFWSSTLIRDLLVSLNKESY